MSAVRRLLLVHVLFSVLPLPGLLWAADRVTPGRFVIEPPTINNLGFRWYIEGDDNANAAVAVSYRSQGERDWKEAIPMLRVHHEMVNARSGKCETFDAGNLFAGSVLLLREATPYEVRFVMTDPDGGAPEPKEVTVSTRAVPVAFEQGRTVHVYPEGHAGSRGEPSSPGIEQALGSAQPGDIILVHGGTYRLKEMHVRVKGEPGKPVVVRGENGKTVLESNGGKMFEVTGSAHLFFENLVIRKADVAFGAGGRGSPGTESLVIRNCHLSDVGTGILSGSALNRNWYVADNTIIGRNRAWFPYTKENPSHTGINLYGQGHVVCHNRIAFFWDCLAMANHGLPEAGNEGAAVDFHNNDFEKAVDDLVETDYGSHNIRVYANRGRNAHCGISAQPMYGGPVYIFRNELFGLTFKPLKLQNDPAGILVFNNTLCSAGHSFHNAGVYNIHLRNNLLLGGNFDKPKTVVAQLGTLAPDRSSFDYNGYRLSGCEQARISYQTGKDYKSYYSLEELSRATGHEAHGLVVDYDVFMKAFVHEEGRTLKAGDYDLRIREASKAVDAGCPIPQITDGFAGKAPDLGCYELGQPLPIYGPRSAQAGAPEGADDRSERHPQGQPGP